MRGECSVVPSQIRSFFSFTGNSISDSNGDRVHAIPLRGSLLSGRPVALAVWIRVVDAVAA
jgi:hypothetical protein